MMTVVAMTRKIILYLLGDRNDNGYDDADDDSLILM
jgi:hypothetical protein